MAWSGNDLGRIEAAGGLGMFASAKVDVARDGLEVESQAWVRGGWTKDDVEKVRVMVFEDETVLEVCGEDIVRLLEEGSRSRTFYIYSPDGELSRSSEK